MRGINLVLVLSCVFAVLFVYTGLSTKKWLYSNRNLCSMTYNSPMHSVKEPILRKPPESRSSSSLWLGLLRNDEDYVLSIYENTATKVGSVLSVDPSTTPVLYLHGFMGNSNQARSISSDMLLDDKIRDLSDFSSFIGKNGGSKNVAKNFTFFTLDFGDSLSALSVDETVSRSIFLNECLSRIQEMYRDADRATELGKTSDNEKVNTESKKPSHPVVLVAHSFGGIVAKLSFLLSNFPSNQMKCSSTVSDLVMLSSPNTTPPFNYDMNMETLFSDVNKAWRNSFYRDCGNSTKYDKFGNFKSSSNRNSNSNNNGFNNIKGDHKITINWNCPLCTAPVRLISVTGGIFDDLVDPELTLLTPMTPSLNNRTRPKAVVNSTAVPSDPNPIGESFFQSIIRGSYNLVLLPFKIIGSFFHSLYMTCLITFRTFYSLSTSSYTFITSFFNAPNNTTVAIDLLGNCSLDNTTCASAFKSDVNAPLFNSSISNSSDSAVFRKFANDNTSRTRYLDQLYVLSNLEPVEFFDSLQPYKEPLHVNLRTSSLFLSQNNQVRKVANGNDRNSLMLVDHNAIVWCQELLRYILNGLSVLKSDTKVKNNNKFNSDNYNFTSGQSKQNNAAKFWSEVFPIKYLNPPFDINFLSTYNCSSTSEGCTVDPRLEGSILYPHVHINNFSSAVANFLYRNESDSQWRKFEGAEHEALFEYLLVQSRFLRNIISIIQYSSFLFVSGKAIPLIVFWYIVISVGIANFFQFELFLGIKSPKGFQFKVKSNGESDISTKFASSYLLREMLDFTKFNSLVHSNLKIALNIVSNSILIMHIDVTGVKNVYLVLSTLFAIFGLYHYYYYFYSSFLPSFSTFVCFVISYFIALLIRIVLHLSSCCIKVILTFVFDVTRKLSMLVFKSGTFLGDISLFHTFFGSTKFNRILFVSLYLIAYALYVSSHTHNDNDQSYYQCLHILLLYSLFGILIAFCCFAPVTVPRGCKPKEFYENNLGRSLYQSDIGLLYLPLLFLFAPTFKLASSSLFPDLRSHYSATGIYEIFDSNHSSITFMMVVVNLHLLVIIFSDSVNHMIIQQCNYMGYFFNTTKETITFLRKLVSDNGGIEKVEDASDSKIVPSAGESATAAVSCIHEDGGKKAVFMKVSDGDLKANNIKVYTRGGVTLGPTYKVYYCNCASVLPRIEFAKDFCEWCRCKCCGGRRGDSLTKPGPSASDPRYLAYISSQQFDNEVNETEDATSESIRKFTCDFLVSNSSMVIFVASYFWAYGSLYRFCNVLSLFALFQLLRLLVA